MIKLDVRIILQGRPRMLTRDLFALAHLVVKTQREKTCNWACISRYSFCGIWTN